MDYSDILLTTPEVGVTIAGFSSLATLIVHAVARQSLSLHTYRFEGMLIVSGYRGGDVTYNTLKFKKSGQPIGAPFYIMTALLIVMIVSLGINIALDLGELAAGFFLVGLFSILANACVLFLLVFLAVLHDQVEETEQSDTTDNN